MIFSKGRRDLFKKTLKIKYLVEKNDDDNDDESKK